jgi:hypothetical protein
MAEYDGWVIKQTGGGTSHFTGFFAWKKGVVIKDFEGVWGKGAWAKERRKGHCKMVKVKLVEVE